MSGSQSLTKDVDIDIKGLFSAIWRKKFLIVFLTLLGGAVIFMAMSAVSPRYKSDAQILIKKRESVFTRIQDGAQQQNGGEFDEQAIGSQVQILSSDDLASRVIKKLDLENHSDFFEKASEPGLLELAKSVLASNPPSIQSVDEDPSEFLVNPGVLKKFKEQLTVYSAERSRVIVVEFWSKDKKLAKLVPNTLAELYLEFAREVTLESDRSATGFLEPEIQDLREKVEAAEAKVAEFRSTSDILLGNNNALLATQQLSEVSSELSRVRSEGSAAESKIASIRAALNNGGSIDVIPEVISSPLIQRLRERQVTTQAEISELSTTLLPNHPRIKALNSQLPEIERQIRIAANNILTSLENNVDLAKMGEATLLQDVNRLKAESSRVSEAEVQLRALEREANAQRERLESYLVRFNEAESRQASGYVPSEARIIEHATIPSEAYFPKVIPFTIAGMTGIALLSILGVLAAELLSGRAFKTISAPGEEDIPEKISINNAPSMAPQMNDLLSDPRPAFAPSSTIANDRDVFGIGFAMEAIEGLQKCKVAVVTPGNRSVSSPSLPIIRHLANRGKSTVLVDFSGEGSAVKSVFGNSNLPGIFDVMAGEVSLREVLYMDNASSAHILTPGNTSNTNADVSRLPQVISALGDSYDFTIFECGNSGIHGISKIADSDTVIIIPVMSDNYAESRALEQALKSAGYSETLMVQASTGSNMGMHNAA
jgi:uncharacterized protein involved in exopolysaccharide biosynthesis/Mrp family chromosome partitioning ATPase